VLNLSNRITQRAVICFAVLAIATGAQATPFDVEQKVTASDAASDDRFGWSVGVSGNVAIVGARLDDDAGSASGSAYLYNATTGSELFKLTADDAGFQDTFGHSVAISGNRAIIGARYDSDAGSNSGSAYLFDVTNGNQLLKLTADDAASGDNFGGAVAISGNTAIVGARNDNDGGVLSGSAYLFNVTTGDELFKLTADDAVASDIFGHTVGISGNVAIVGAHENDDAGNASGSAYLFNVTNGDQLYKLTADDAAAFDHFGVSVAVSGDVAIVGAHFEDDEGLQSGSAYLFDVTTGDQLLKLNADDAMAGDQFGWSVGISGNIAIVGAYQDDHGGGDSGSAYLFDVTTGDQLLKLTASDAANLDYFGAAVAVSGDKAIIGAYQDDDGGGDSGSAYLYSSVPEPSTFVLATLGLLSLGMRRRRRRRR